MPDDKDLALSLPDPPPPAPTRREAAIETALRRFDGIEDGAARPTPTPRKRGWLQLNRPQLGTLVAAGLVALIFAPVAWMTANQRIVPATEMAADVRQQQDFKTSDVETTRLGVAPPPVILPETRQPAPSPATEPSAPAVMADAAEAPAPQQSGILAERREAPPVIHVEAPSAPRAMAGADNASLAQAVPAPAAKAAASDRRDEAKAYESIVVTGARRSAGRGDWNACTVNDPDQDIARCKRLIDHDAAGTKRPAAAYVTYGLARAWEGDNDAAITAFDRAIAIAPKLSIAYLNRGLVLGQEGDTDRAIADLDKAVRYAPQAPRGYYNRSLLLRERGDARRARADEDKALAIDPGYEAVIK
jgi:Flp pilus assembly protein TadD